MRSPEAFDRMLDICPNPANAINFCQGCFTQMLPPEQLYATIDHFVRRGAVAFVHFRNVTGHQKQFTEAFWDDGKADMAQAMAVYQKAGFDGYSRPITIHMSLAIPSGDIAAAGLLWDISAA